MPPLEDKSLRDELVEAFKADPRPDETPSSSAPASSEPVSEPAKESSAPAAAPKNITSDTTPSDPARASREPAKDPAKAGEQPPLEPPVRWTKTQKENFHKWPREVQEQVLAENRGYQADYTRKSMELAQERKRYEGFEKVLAPRRQSFRGLDDTAALEQIMQHWDHAGRDPQGFIQSFAQQRGIDLAAMYAPTQEQLNQYFQQYYAQLSGQPGVPQSQGALHPAVQARLDALERDNHQMRAALGQTQQYLGSREQQEMQRTWASVADELRAFENATDTNGQLKYPFYHDVREDMAQLLDKGLARDLNEAYTKATRLRDDVFGKIQETQEVQRTRSEEQRRAAEAAAAKRAGASVSSSSVDYTEPLNAGAELSLREELERSFAAARTRNRI